MIASTSDGDEPLPELFRLWILEWPAKATISWHWPGIGPQHSYSPFRYFLDQNCLDVHRTRIETMSIYETTTTNRWATGMSRIYKSIQLQVVNLRLSIHNCRQILVLGGDRAVTGI